MEEGGMNYSKDKNPPKVLFGYYRGRRSATINALTIDVELFFQQCDPEKKNLCLYGHSNGIWELICPTNHFPADIPEPLIGINFARDGTEYNKWLLNIATHTDSWLLSVSFYYAARCGYDQRERMELFDMINELPTVREAVIEYHMKKKKSSEDEESDEIMKDDEEEKCGAAREVVIEYQKEKKESSRDEEVKCGACGKVYGSDEEFWFRCGGCKTYFHHKCVAMTRFMTGQKIIYRCPDCC